MAACQASDATICARMAACQASNATIRARMAASRAWESRQLCPNGPIARSWWRSGPGLPDSLRLELRTRQGSARDDATVEAHAQRLPQVGLQALGREIVARGLDQQGHLVHLALAPALDHELGDLRVAAHYVLHLGGIEIHPAHREHLVHSSLDEDIVRRYAEVAEFVIERRRERQM